MPILLQCHPGIGPAVAGTALVAADNLRCGGMNVTFTGVYRKTK